MKKSYSLKKILISSVRILKRVYNIAHTKIYSFLLRHPFLDALSMLIRRAKEKEFCKLVAGRNDLSLVCCSYGEANKDKNIYFIHHGKEGNGFFAQMRQLLKYLAYADRFGFVPVVSWDSKIPYAEKEKIMGTGNPFEYFFLQPTDISIEEVYRSYNVFHAQKIHIESSFLDRETNRGENGYWMSEEFMGKMSQYVKKYIRLNENTQKYICDGLEQIKKDYRTIGVHIRGTDFNNHYDKHPIAISVKKYFEAIDKMLEERGYNQIFLATDDMRILNEFVGRYSDLLVYYEDVMRENRNCSVAFSENVRVNHKYLLGLEVLRDMYTLVSCEALVAGISQVSLLARIFKVSMGDDYEQKVIFDEGYYSNNNVFIR